MSKELTAKSFKSGNSVALRLPKGLGIEADEDLVIAPHPDGSLSIWRKSDSKRVFMNLYGSMSPGFMSKGRGDIEQDDREWGGDPRDSAA